MTATENNVAAQAGDEPMRAGAEAAFERYSAKQKYIVGMPALPRGPATALAIKLRAAPGHLPIITQPLVIINE